MRAADPVRLLMDYSIDLAGHDPNTVRFAIYSALLDTLDPQDMADILRALPEASPIARRLTARAVASGAFQAVARLSEVEGRA